MNRSGEGSMIKARHEGLVVQELPDEVLVYDLTRHKAHCLNKTAAFIWNRCDGQTAVSEMTGLLERELGSPVREEVVWYTLDRLSRADLLEETWQRPAGALLSRRRMVKLGLGSLVGVAMVTSLAAPAAGQATTLVQAGKAARGQCVQQNNVLCENGCCTAAPGSPTRRLCVFVAPGDLACTGPPCAEAGTAKC